MYVNWLSHGLRSFVSMGQMIRECAEPNCPVCGMPMVLVHVDPRVASFSELRTFRCFACDDIRTTAQKTLRFARVGAVARQPAPKVVPLRRPFAA